VKAWKIGGFDFEEALEKDLGVPDDTAYYWFPTILG
jgi:hypothetical protein